MSEPRVRIIFVTHWKTPCYEVCAKADDGKTDMAYLDTAKAAFDYCLEHYPGEPVTVDIRP